MLANLLHDVRYALHGFASRPMFAAVVVLTLAVGIGVNVAVFSLYDQLMLRELNVERPHELVKLVSRRGDGPVNRISNEQGPGDETFSYLMFRDLERAGAPYVGLSASRMVQASLARDGGTTVGSVVLVSGGFFATLGVGPEIGRVLGEQDVADGTAANAAMLSYDYWQTAYAADPGVLGRTLVVAGHPLTIVGVAARGFVGTTPGSQPQVFAPLTLEWHPRGALLNGDRLFYYLYVVGRLEPGVTVERAQDVLNATHSALVADVDTPLAVARTSEFDIDAFRTATLSLASAARGQTRATEFARTPLATFFAATATILLIACVNLANLMFARAAARIGEIAIRASLGAARRRLLEMLSVEALLLAGFAALLSLPIALGVLRGVEVLRPPGLDVYYASLEPRTVAAAFVIAALSALVFALAPTVKLVATDPARALQSNGARSFGGKHLGRFRFALATTQIALSMLLLVLAALFAQSLVNIARVDLGLRTESVVTFRLIPGLNGYPRDKQLQVFERVASELAARPGVLGVSSAAVALLDHSEWGTSVDVDGLELQPQESMVNANRIGTGFFTTLDIPLLAGRDFTAADAAGRPQVAIVNESFAKRFRLGANPVGQRIGFDPPSGPLDTEIVGLVRDSAYAAVKTDFPAQLMLPLAQAQQLESGAAFYVRTMQAPEALLAAVPDIVATVDPDLPVIEASTFDSVVRRNVQTDWLLVTLAGVLASVATLLAAIGLYGVLSYMVAQRTHEIGLRLALGAEQAGVRRMVMKQVVWMVAVGVPVGLGAALLIGNLASAVLFDLAPTDPRALVAAASVLAAAVLAASYWPARRASRVDPVVALRAA